MPVQRETRLVTGSAFCVVRILRILCSLKDTVLTGMR